jgi:hypothetical protein
VREVKAKRRRSGNNSRAASVAGADLPESARSLVNLRLRKLSMPSSGRRCRGRRRRSSRQNPSRAVDAAASCARRGGTGRVAEGAEATASRRPKRRWSRNRPAAVGARASRKYRPKRPEVPALPGGHRRSENEKAATSVAAFLCRGRRCRSGSGLGRDVAGHAHDAVLRVDVDQLRRVPGEFASLYTAKLAMIRMSPGAARRAAEPLTEMTPDPRSARRA